MTSDFSRLVDTIIGPLLRNYGFELNGQAADYARYSSGKTGVVFTWNRYSGEVSVAFDISLSANLKCSLRDVVAFHSCNPLHSNLLFQAHSEKNLVAICRVIKSLMEDYCLEILHASMDIFLSVTDFARQRDCQFTDDVVSYPKRMAAESAWARKDYLEVVRLYSSIQTFLTESERRRLDYAIRHSSSD